MKTLTVSIKRTLACRILITCNAVAFFALISRSSAAEKIPEGLAASDWTSIRAAYDAHRHAAVPTENGYRARNPGQQWQTQFDGRGFIAQPDAGGWQWGLELRSYGLGDDRQTVTGKAEARAEGQRVIYKWDAAVEEWFVNDQRGLEHGFTIKERPAGGGANGRLEFDLAVRGDLRPKVSADGNAITFVNPNGAAVVTYSALKVWDAGGKILPARFEKLVTGHSPLVTIAVDDRGARYPLTIDPIAQQAYLKPAAFGTTQAADQFGISVAVSGDTVVVGAGLEDSSTTGVNSTPDELAGQSGAAYVFVRSGTTWTQQAYLKPAAVGTAQAGDSFGFSVAISGDTVVVGALGEDSSTTGVNSTPDDTGGIIFNAGAAYVFIRSGTTWTQQAYLKPAAVGTTQAGDRFGNSVAISDDTVVVGAHVEDSSTTGVNSTPNDAGGVNFNSGAAYVFTRSGTTWTQQAYLKPDAVGTTQAADQFGDSVTISGDTLVVGASQEDGGATGVNGTVDEGASAAGAAYVFTRSGTTWTQQAYLKPAAFGTTQVQDFFGGSVALSGETLVVGARNEDSSSTGVNSTPNETGIQSGAAYVFTRSGTTWTQQAYLKPAAFGSSPSSDGFGSVAISGDTVVVGAFGEDSNTTGINSTPEDSGGGSFNSGAAYVFTRSGTTWTQQAYLKPAAVGTTQGGDQFGLAVAVSGETVLIGANLEDSNTTGVNSTADESAADSGAAYVFALPPCTPPPSGMIGWWSGDNTARDLAGMHDGTLQGGATYAAGKVAAGFSFDGNGDYVDVGDVDLPITFTIDAWINPTDLSAGPIVIASNNGSYLLQVVATGALRAEVVTITGDITRYETGAVISAGTWQHVAVTYDGSAGPNQKCKFYVNGVNVAASAPPCCDNGGTPADSSTAARIGIGPVANDFNGLIDELEVFSRALSASEIQAIYDADYAGKCKQVIYVSNAGNSTIVTYDVAGNPSVSASTGLNGPRGLAFDAAGNLYVANSGDDTIEKFDANGSGTLFADSGDGVEVPQGLAFDVHGNLYVANSGASTILKIDPSGVATSFASAGLNQPYGLAFDAAGALYVANFADSTIEKFPASGGHSTFADGGDGISGPDALAFDTSGNLFVSNFTNDTITKLTSGGVGSTFADSADLMDGPWGMAFDRAGFLYVVNALISPNTIRRFDSNGSPTTFANSGMNGPAFLAIRPGIIPFPAPAPVDRQFLNISTRAFVGTGQSVEIAGFIIQDSATATATALLQTNGGGPSTKTVLIRGIGPSLGITGKLEDPFLSLRDQNGTEIASNDSWQTADGTQTATDISNTGLAPSNPLEAALLRNLNVDESYTAIMSGVGGTTGIGLVEVYDLQALQGAQLANISTRGFVGTGSQVMIGGVIVRGTNARRVVFRAMGLSLPASILNRLQDPQLDIRDEQGTLLAHNDDWKEEPDGVPNATREAQIIATGLAPTNDAEAAILFTPSPGNYTAIMTGVGGTTGIGLVEAYNSSDAP